MNDVPEQLDNSPAITDLKDAVYNEDKTSHNKAEGEENEDDAGEAEGDHAYERGVSEQPEMLELLANPRAMDILRGVMEDLPAMPSNTVRIFLSSTFSGLLYIHARYLGGF